MCLFRLDILKPIAYPSDHNVNAWHKITPQQKPQLKKNPEYRDESNDLGNQEYSSNEVGPGVMGTNVFINFIDYGRSLL